MRYRRRRAIVIASVLFTLLGLIGWQQVTQAATPKPAPVSFATTPSGRGYWVVYASGQVRAFGDARLHGDAHALHLNSPVVGIAATTSGKGYWLVAADGGVFNYGDARFAGSVAKARLKKPAVGITAAPNGHGYWVVAGDGGVFSYGGAQFFGSASVLRLRSPITGIAPTTDSRGYWMVAQNGEVFAFGDASVRGTAAGRTRSAVTTIVRAPAGHAYWLSTSDGHVWGYGDRSVLAAATRQRPVLGMARHSDGTFSMVTIGGAVVRYAEYYSESAAGPPSSAPVTVPTTQPPWSPPPTTAPPTTPTTAPPGAPSPDPSPTWISSNIDSYITLAGDQVVTVPNGVYTAGSVTAPHAATSGPFHGFLVLRAESEHGVVVNLANSPLTLNAGTSRIVFVGFTFVNGSVFDYGNNIDFWYTDHSFPANVWSAQAPSPADPEAGLYRAPRTIYTNAESSQSDGFYGVDAHDTGTAFMISGSRNELLEGVNVWNLSDLGLDPHDVIHPDAIGAPSGDVSGFTVRDSWIKGRIMLQDGPGKGGASGGPFTNFLFQDDWVSNSPSCGFTFTSDNPSTPRGLFGRRVDVRSWDQHNGLDRLEIIDGVQITKPNTDPSRVDVVDSGIDTSAPPPDMASPAQNWRAAHPYDSWFSTLFG
jgi:hypothetical protein